MIFCDDIMRLIDMLAEVLRLLRTAFVESSASAILDHSTSIEKRVVAVQRVSLPVSIPEELLVFYCQKGRYDKAEDVPCERLAHAASYAIRGLAFDERLLAKR